MAVINTPLRGEEKDAFKKLLKPQQQNKLLNPKEKIGEKSGRTLPIRGNT